MSRVSKFSGGSVRVDLDCTRVPPRPPARSLTSWRQDGQKIETVQLDGRKQAYKVVQPRSSRTRLSAPGGPWQGLRHRAQTPIAVPASRRVHGTSYHYAYSRTSGLQIQGTHLFITDTGSSHGTYVEGRRIPPCQPHLLKSGMKCWFGGSTRWCASCQYSCA